MQCGQACSPWKNSLPKPEGNECIAAASRPPPEGADVCALLSAHFVSVCVCMCANFDWCLTYSMKTTGLFFQFLNIKSFYNDYTFPIAHLGDNHVIGISQLREGCRRYTDVKDKKWGKRTRFQPSRSSRWSVCGWPRNQPQKRTR